MASGQIWHLLHCYLLTSVSIIRFLFKWCFKLHRIPVFVTLIDTFLSLYFWSCGLCPCSVDVDDETTMHFWISNHRRFNKPKLVLVHGYGGNSRWQFMKQVASLSQSFNLFIPDLLFFGKSYTRSPVRSDTFQARCIVEGLRRLGVHKFSVYAISYGGYVAYRMAETCQDEIEKVVIVSSGIGCTEEQKVEQLKKIGRNAMDLLLPEKPQDLRILVNLSIYKCNPFKWMPDCFLREFIDVMCNKHRKEKAELAEHLLRGEADKVLPPLCQETLIIWGDQDKVFPLSFAHLLHRHLGSRSKLEILKNTGHAANIESPESINDLIKSFVLCK